MFYSRGVVFLESEFPYAEKLSSTPASMEPVLQQNSDHVCRDDEFQDRPLSEILDRAEPTGAAEPICEVSSPAVPSSNAETKSHRQKMQQIHLTLKMVGLIQIILRCRYLITLKWLKKIQKLMRSPLI